jgi:cytochrome b6-f complex iron-sulfur subunit
MPDPNDVHDPSAETETGLDRRRFLNGTWKALGVVLIAEGAWTSYDILNPRSSQGAGSVIDAGPVSDYMEEGTVQYFLSGRFYVTQYQGGLRALYQKCPHLGCRVPFCDSSGQFECPCHGSFYNVIGEYIRGPAPRGMDRFKISISGDRRVLVDTATVLPGPAKGVRVGPADAAGPSCTSVEGEAAASPAPSADASGTASPSGGAP